MTDESKTIVPVWTLATRDVRAVGAEYYVGAVQHRYRADDSGRQ
ncbi:hypothetical protein [Streptomyces sp. NPDC050264]